MYLKEQRWSRTEPITAKKSSFSISSLKNESFVVDYIEAKVYEFFIHRGFRDKAKTKVTREYHQ